MASHCLTDPCHSMAMRCVGLMHCPVLSETVKVCRKQKLVLLLWLLRLLRLLLICHLAHRQTVSKCLTTHADIFRNG